MIPFDFEYFKPSSAFQAVNLYKTLSLQGKEPLYYAGGTEIISMARRNDIFTKAVIDIKGIPECNMFELQSSKLIIGAAITLTEIEEANVFPLLGKAASKAADHTARNKITVGGNICGKIMFKEAVLPFMLADSQVSIAGEDGYASFPINQLFDKKLQLLKGDLLVQLVTDVMYTQLPYVSIKRTKLETIDYPLITIAALKKYNEIRVAFSGVCPFPFRSLQIEEDLNDRSAPPRLRINKALSHLPAPILNNIEGSASYRKFVLKSTLLDMLAAFGGG